MEPYRDPANRNSCLRLRSLGDKGKETARGIRALVRKIDPAPKADDGIRIGAADVSSSSFSSCRSDTHATVMPRSLEDKLLSLRRKE